MNTGVKSQEGLINQYYNQCLSGKSIWLRYQTGPISQEFLRVAWARFEAFVNLDIKSDVSLEGLFEKFLEDFDYFLKG
jgi:hypothetical protein